MSHVLDFRIEKKETPIESINLKFHPRERVAPERVELFVDLLKAGHVFDPIRVARYDSQGILYLIDGRYRLEAHRQMSLEMIEYELVKAKEAFWLLTSAKCNSGGSEQLTYSEMKKIIVKSYEAYGLEPQEIHAYLKQQCSLRWIYKVLGPLLRQENAETKQKVVALRKQGKKYNEIERETGINRRTAQRYVQETSALVEAQFADDGWNILKEGIEQIRELSPNDETTLFALYYAKQGQPVNEISAAANCASNIISISALCLLFIYHYGDVSDEVVSEKLGIAEEKVAFIKWLRTRCPKILPEREPLLGWILGNISQQHHTSKYVDILLRREKLFAHYKSMGLPVPWEHTDPKEILQKEDLPPQFFDTLETAVKMLMELKKLCENKILAKPLAKAVMELNNRIRIVLNNIGGILQKQL